MHQTIPNIMVRIESDRERLKKSKSSLLGFVHAGRDGSDFLSWKIEALYQLRDFQNRLAKHFDLEEEGGLFTQLLRLAPNASYRINSLAAEHGEILEAISDAITSLKAAGSTDADTHRRLRDDVDRILERIREHESLEQEMMYSAHNRVFGVGD